jgi:digeranylgeranylglycerophospholipid reductase
MHDIVIIGGGPIGSYTAGRLTAKGYKVLVLEKKQRVGESVCCTGIVGMECVQRFNIKEKLILRKVDGASLYPPSRKELYIKRPVPQACILDRVGFDISMAEKAQSAGAEYSFNSRATDVDTDQDGVTITVSRPKEQQEIRARAVVIATGFTPPFLRRIGLGTFEDYCVGVQVEIETNDVENVEVYFGEPAPGFFAWVVPVEPPVARIGLLMRKTPGIYLKKWLKELESQGRITNHRPAMSYGAIPLKPLPRTYGERLVVVGDAAGQAKPTSGGGIYYGLIGAEIAANTLDNAFADGDLSMKSLAQYERSWKKQLGWELTVGYWARKIFERLSEKQIDRIFEIVKSSNIDEAMLKAPDLSFDWHSKTIIRLVRHQMVARTMKVFKLPFKTSHLDQPDGNSLE